MSAHRHLRQHIERAWDGLRTLRAHLDAQPRSELRGYVDQATNGIATDLDMALETLDAAERERWAEP